MRLSVRSNHFNINSCNCDGLGYDFNLMGYAAHPYAYIVNKDIVHSTYGDPHAQSHFTSIPSYSRISDIQRFPLLRWIGMKFVVRTITSSDNVRLEAYRDITNGQNGGDWVKLADIEDTGVDMAWGATKPATM